MKAVRTGQILIRKGRIWTARPRIDRAVTFQASAPRIFNAAALIALVEAGSAGIASVVAVDLVVIALVAVDSIVAAEALGVAAGLGDSAAVEDSGAGDEN